MPACAHLRPSPSLSHSLLSPPGRIRDALVQYAGPSQSSSYEKKHQNLRERLDHMPPAASLAATLELQTLFGSSAVVGLLLYPNELELYTFLRS